MLWVRLLRPGHALPIQSARLGRTRPRRHDAMTRPSLQAARAYAYGAARAHRGGVRGAGGRRGAEGRGACAGAAEALRGKCHQPVARSLTGVSVSTPIESDVGNVPSRVRLGSDHTPPAQARPRAVRAPAGTGSAATTSAPLGWDEAGTLVEIYAICARVRRALPGAPRRASARQRSPSAVAGAQMPMPSAIFVRRPPV